LAGANHLDEPLGRRGIPLKSDPPVREEGRIEMRANGLKGKALQRGTLVGSSVILVFLSIAWLSSRPDQSKTLQNLQAAYNGEANAHARYLAFADQAQHEEHYDVAGLFRAAAYAEYIHLERFGEEIRKVGVEPVPRIGTPIVKTTAENLRVAADEGEAYERDIIYPRFIKEAEADGNEGAVRAFQLARIAETQHFKLLKAALANLKTTGIESRPYYVCRVCGYTSDHPVRPCPGCGDQHAVFAEVH
jgi:rubrerythrin